MTRRIIVKNIRAGIPSKTSRLVDLNDVTGSPSGARSFVQWDSDQNKFVFSESTVSDALVSSLVDSAVVATVDSDFINSILGTSVNAATLNSQPGSYYLDYTNFTNTPDIGTDSAGVSLIIADDVDKAFIDALSVDADTLDGQHGAYYLDFGNLTNVPTNIGAGTDSASVSLIITEDVDKAFVDALNVDANTLDGQDGTYYLDYGNFNNTPFILDSNNVQGMIDSSINALDTHDSAAVQGQINSTLSGDVTVGGNLTVDGYIAGPVNMVIDPATIGTDSGTLTILGNLVVEGETTTVNSTTVTISDKNIVLADSATNNTQANDAGITVNGSNAAMQYKSTGDKWEFNKALFYGADRVLTTADGLLYDSNLVQGQIDSAVNQDFVRSFIDQNFINTFVTHESDLTQAQIDSSLSVFDFHDSAAVQGQIDSSLSSLDTHDSAAVLGQINGVIAATSIGDLIDVDLSNIQDNYVIKWDSDNNKFIGAVDVASGGAGADADTLDGQDGTYYLNYNNFTNTPFILDSNNVSGLIDSALAGFTSYDSAAVQGQIDSAVNQDFVRGFIDQTFINTFVTHESDLTQAQIDSSISVLDTHDSAAVLGQINLTVDQTYVRNFIDQSFINSFVTHESDLTQAQIDSSISVLDTHDSAAVLGQINLTVDQTYVRNFIDQSFINSFVTHESDLTQAQIDSSLSVFDFHDSAAVVGQINLEVDKAFVDALSVDADTVDGLQANQFLRSDADDTTTGNLTVEGNLTTSNLITFEGDSATIASAGTGIVAIASMSSVQAMEATIVSVNATNGNRQVSRVLLTHDTTDTYMNEYAVITTTDSDQFNVNADTSTGSFRLKIDNISGNTLFAKSSITYL